MITDFPKSIVSPPLESALTNELAYLGGPPIISKDSRKTIFPNITKEDILQMMISLNQNPEDVVRQFELEYRQYVGAEYAIATASGTSSLHLALIGVGVEPGDEVIVPGFTFIATAQAVVAAHAIPIFVDINPKTYCMDPASVERAITRKTKAVMPVHVHGLPADMDALSSLVAKHGLKLVEDASHAHSAAIRGRRCGSIGDAAGQSLMADKNFPVGGEGGMAFFKTRPDYERTLTFLEYTGIDYRMSWVAAAFGLSQLRRLPYYDGVRARNARKLRESLATTGLFSPPFVPDGYTHSYNMYRIGLNPDAIGLARIEVHKVKEAIQILLTAEGVPAREWQNQPIPAHRPFRNKIGFGDGYPFNLSARKDIGYDAGCFPNILKMLESTLVLCRELRSPVEYERILAYAAAFDKIARRPDAIETLACQMENRRPYEKDARLG